MIKIERIKKYIGMKKETNLRTFAGHDQQFGHRETASEELL